MKIALFSAYLGTTETIRYQESARKLGHDLDVIPLQALTVEMSVDGKIDLTVGSVASEKQEEAKELELDLNIVSPGADLSIYDSAILRGANRTGEIQRAQSKLLIYAYFEQQGKPVLNGLSLLEPAGNKLVQHYLFTKAGVPVVPTKFIQDAALIDEAVSEMEFPIFVKEFRGSHGTRTNAPKSVEELKEIYNSVDMPAYLLVQKKLEMNWDVRVLVVGDQVLGGMKRTAAEGSHVSNFSAGGSIEMIELTDEEKEIALASAKALNAEYGGADLMRDKDGNIYVLEFNRNASFKGFEEATNIDVPAKVFEYLETKI